MNTISIAATTSVFPTNQPVNSSITEHGHSSLQPNAVSETEKRSTVVSISSEAINKLADEKKAIGKALAEQMQSKDADKAKESSESDADRIDKMIKNIQEQIKAVQQQISALNNEKSDQAQATRKALEAQLASLNATLIGLLGKKMKAVEASA